MSVQIESILPAARDEVYIQWAVDVDALAPSPTLFQVERSGSPGGPWEVRATGLDALVYVDVFADAPDSSSEENLLKLTREVWYRIGTTQAGLPIAYSAPTDLFGHTPFQIGEDPVLGTRVDGGSSHPLPHTPFDSRSGLQKRLVLIQHSVARNVAIALENFNGVQVALLKRRQFGARCTVCFVKGSNSTLLSHCPQCYGTSYSGGYFTPILTLGRMIDEPVQGGTAPSGTIQVQHASFELLNFPLVHKDDILVEIDANRRWILTPTHTRSLRRRTITQHVRCSELGRSSVAFKLSLADVVNAATLVGS